MLKKCLIVFKNNFVHLPRKSVVLFSDFNDLFLVIKYKNLHNKAKLYQYERTINWQTSQNWNSSCD